MKDKILVLAMTLIVIAMLLAMNQLGIDLGL